MSDADLRRTCLEWAFKTRDLTGVAHMEVTNVAESYYRWVKEGISQGNALKARFDTAMEWTLVFLPGQESPVVSRPGEVIPFADDVCDVKTVRVREVLE